jgi:hypothetical protein
MNMEQVKEFVALENRKRELDSELKAIVARLDDLEQALVPQFLNDGASTRSSSMAVSSTWPRTSTPTL